MSDTLPFIIYLLILIACFPALYHVSKSYFISSLESISRRLKIRSDIAGSTLMAAGSSTPELAVVLFALLKSGDHGAIGVGTIVGSALFLDQQRREYRSLISKHNACPGLFL